MKTDLRKDYKVGSNSDNRLDYEADQEQQFSTALLDLRVEKGNKMQQS